MVNTRLGEDSPRLTCFCEGCQVNDVNKFKQRSVQGVLHVHDFIYCLNRVLVESIAICSSILQFLS